MNIFSTKNVVIIGGVFLILILFASTSQPVKQAVLGASELLPFIPSPKTDADTIEGKTIQEWLESAHPINAATLNGNPGLFYLDADNITGEISTGKFSAYDDLVAEGIIPDGSKLITETDSENIQNEDPFAVEASDTLELSKVGNQLSGTVIQSGIKSSLINNDSGFIVNLKSFSTSDLKEGANLYFSLN